MAKKSGAKKDEQAQDRAREITASFWEDFDEALSPKLCSKRAYLEMLDAVCADADSRYDAARAELAEEEGE